MIEYDPITKTWKVDIPDWGVEEGNLLYVIGEYVGTNLFFPFNIGRTQNSDYQSHAHEFDGVLKALLLNPTSFSIDGFEKYYSEQEIHLLHELQKKLCSEKG